MVEPSERPRALEPARGTMSVQPSRSHRPFRARGPTSHPTCNPIRRSPVPLPVLQIVIASTRPGRVGLPVATWIAERARAHGGFAVEVVDLAEVNLPIFNEPRHPKLGQYEYQHTKDWSTTVSRARRVRVRHPRVQPQLQCGDQERPRLLAGGVGAQGGRLRQLRRRRGRHAGGADAEAGRDRVANGAGRRRGQHPVHRPAHRRGRRRCTPTRSWTRAPPRCWTNSFAGPHRWSRCAPDRCPGRARTGTRSGPDDG